MKTMKFLTAAALATVLASSAMAQQTQRVKGTVDKVDGNTLTGTVSGPQGDMEISDGKIDGDTISFTQTMEFNGNTMKILYKGTISGDSIKFTREREGGGGQAQGRKGGPMEFTAKRAS